MNIPNYKRLLSLETSHRTDLCLSEYVCDPKMASDSSTSVLTGGETEREMITSADQLEIGMRIEAKDKYGKWLVIGTINKTYEFNI